MLPGAFERFKQIGLASHRPKSTEVFDLDMTKSALAKPKLEPTPYLPSTPRPPLTLREPVHRPVLERRAATVLDDSQLATKRVVDVVLGVAALVALFPLFLLVAGAVKLTSAGPVVFRQRRVGLGGKTFDILKFRSMTVDAEARQSELQGLSVYGDPRLFKVADDPRVTPIGRFLRKASLDELPQLFNVLRGEMSLVGPRPPTTEEVALYEAHHYCRFDVKPGITGPWQVGGRNKITDFEAVIRLEQDYMRNWSTAVDLKILLKTIPAVLRMDGAH
jgi:lipopolysaccharide/colanic/teichoic acid biosynthesis glycosyltransferase